MSGLLDFFQSASNAAAGNVSGPVDIISAALNRLGIPVQNAVGGSDWMKQKGLMRDVPQSASSLAGETFGLLGPMAVAAKAPQIAGGLLRVGENAAAPKIMRSQAGAVDAGLLFGMDKQPQTAKELRDALLAAYKEAREQSPYKNIGVRVIGADQKTKVGDKLARSSKWVDGVPLSTKLPGTAVFQLRANEDDALRAINNALAYNTGDEKIKIALVTADELAPHRMPEAYSALFKRPEVFRLFDRTEDIKGVTRTDELRRLLGMDLP